MSKIITILAAIKTAPHAVSVREIAERTNIDGVATKVNQLVRTGLVVAGTRNCAGKFFTNPAKRATVTTFLGGEVYIKNTLQSIKSAPHAINITRGMTIEALLDAKLIKEHSRKRGYFFTNPDMQDVVAEFMAPGPVPTFLVPTPQSTPTVASPSGLVCSSLDKQVLRAIKSAPHAVDHQEIVRLVNDNPLCVGTSIGFLAGLGLIRMHRSKPNHYFTNSDKAGEINTLLATVATTTPQGEPVPTDAVLAMLRLSEHGISMNGVWKAFEKLVAEGLVRADKRDVDAKSKDVRYFVRKGKRREGDLRAKADKRIAKLIAGNDDLVDYVNEAADSIG